MSARVNAHSIICPGCLEKVFMDELVAGHCPLCGCVMEEEEEFEEVIDRSDLAWIVFQYYIFQKLDAMGVSPLQIMNLISRLEEQCGNGFPNIQRLEFRLEAPMRPWEHLLPKRCSHCRKWFLRRGRKILTGNLNEQGFAKEYLCPSC